MFAPQVEKAASTRLPVGRAADPLEHEADHIADQVMRSSAPSGTNAMRHDGGPGQPLDAETRAFMEPRFGHDFSKVRVRADRTAAQSAHSLGAAAYTVGHEVVFGTGCFAPGTSAGRRLIAHELAHVVQQRQLGPVIQRQPFPAYKSTDQVEELKPVLTPDGEAWRLTVSGDFLTPQAVGRLIWPTRATVPAGVSITPIFTMSVEMSYEGQKGKPPAGYAQRGEFLLHGMELFTVGTMEPSFQKLFAERGLVEESKSLQAARKTFRTRHSTLGVRALNNIDDALKRVTRDNHDLRESYYRFYANWKLTADISRSSKDAGATDHTIRRGGFTDLNAGVLNLENLHQIPTDDTLSLLGTTLIHEYAHTAHASDYLKGPGEGKAYGVENFFAERLGDKKRDETTHSVGPRMGDEKAYQTSYFVMKKLYEVMDTNTSKLPSLRGVSAERAKAMTVEFVSKNKSGFSAELKNFIINELGQAAFNSLPSQETR